MARTLSSEITAAYAAPRAVAARQLALAREERTLGLFALFCFVTLIGRTPQMMAQARADEVSLVGVFGASFVGIMLVMPLMLYAISGLATLLLRQMGHPLSWVQGRAIFGFAAVVVCPLVLATAALQGFGASPLVTALQFATFAVFLWQYLSGIAAARGEVA